MLCFIMLEQQAQPQVYRNITSSFNHHVLQYVTTSDVERKLEEPILFWQGLDTNDGMNIYDLVMTHLTNKWILSDYM